MCVIRHDRKVNKKRLLHCYYFKCHVYPRKKKSEYCCCNEVLCVEVDCAEDQNVKHEQRSLIAYFDNVSYVIQLIFMRNMWKPNDCSAMNLSLCDIAKRLTHEHDVSEGSSVIRIKYCAIIKVCQFCIEDRF